MRTIRHATALGGASTATPALGHSGRLPGLATEAWSIPDRGRTVVVFVNGDGNAAAGTLDVVREAALCG